MTAVKHALINCSNIIKRKDMPRDSVVSLKDDSKDQSSRVETHILTALATLL